MIKETKTIISKYHKYQVPFDEFWDAIKDSKVIDKSLYFSSMFRDDNMLTVHLAKNKLEDYVKLLKLEGRLSSVVSAKDGMIEITTTEEEVK